MKKPRYTPHIKELDLNKKKSLPVPQEVLDSIAKDLESIMKTRGLWFKSPSWLGYGDERWDIHSTEFKHLTLFFYHKAILTRIRGLKNQAATGKNVDSYVVTNIKNDLSQLQAKHDKVGHAVYQNLNTAVNSLLTLGIVIAHMFLPWYWKKTIHKMALLSFASSNSTRISEEEEIHQALHKNPAYLKPCFLVSLGRKNKKLEEPLSKVLCQLRESDIHCFRFENLVKAVTRDVRCAECEDYTGNGGSKKIINLANCDYQEFCQFCEILRASIDTSKHQDQVHVLLHKVLTEREKAVKERFTPLSPQEVASRLKNIDIDQIEKAYKELPSPPSVEQLAFKLGLTSGDLNKAMIKPPKKIPSQQTLAECLNVAVATINTDIKILRELASPIKMNTWGTSTLYLVEIMLK